MKSIYSSPVNKLLTVGEPGQFWGWPDYLEYGFTEEHIPELIRMVTDPELNGANSESTEVWAPLHAWRTLGQLHAEAAIGPLVALLDPHDDWISDELPMVFGMIGPQAIPVLAEYLADTTHELYARICAANGLEQIAATNPETRSKCLQVLVEQLERMSENDPTLNGFLISDLIDLKGHEAIPVIRAAFAADAVDISVTGDLEDVEILLGLRQQRSIPKPKYYPELAKLQTEMNLPKEQPWVEQKAKKRKVGRNDSCPCGSGKKYKKCCLKRG